MEELQGNFQSLNETETNETTPLDDTLMISEVEMVPKLDFNETFLHSYNSNCTGPYHNQYFFDYRYLLAALICTIIIAFIIFCFQLLKKRKERNDLKTYSFVD